MPAPLARAGLNKTLATGPDRRPSARHTSSSLCGPISPAPRSARSIKLFSSTASRFRMRMFLLCINCRNFPFSLEKIRCTASLNSRELFLSLDLDRCLFETHVNHPKYLERETGIEPATNSLEGCDSTTELLPLSFATSRSLASNARDFGCGLPLRSRPQNASTLEPMTRIELVTSPLPRECSTN